MASCIFCDSPDASREHVWPHWLSKVLAENGSFYQVAEHLDVRHWTQNSQDLPLVTKRVCTACNNGWMSQLENHVRPTLEPMIRGIPVQIQPIEQLILVRWIVKTAMALEHTGASVRRKFFSPLEHLGIRTGQAMPEHLYIWLAHVVDPAIAAWASEDDLAFHLDDFPNEETGIAYTSTLSAGAFAFQLVCLRAHPRVPAVMEAEFTNDVGWAGYSVQLWPVLPECTWPPSQSLDHERLKQYGARFARGA